MRYAMIMAGGAGTRLWPMSRKDLPKQLIPFIEPAPNAEGVRAGERRSLLEMAVRRLDALIDPSRIYICTSEAYRPLIRKALPWFPDAQILGEPAARDTVNAVGFTAAVLNKLDKDAVFAVLTSDHVIEPEAIFKERMEMGFKLVEQDPSRLVTFWITPTFAATGYGYIERGSPIATLPEASGLAFRVARFVEKPDLHRAQVYLQSGDFGWNSGMFVWHAGTVMKCLERFVPDGHRGLVKIQQAWGTPEQARVLGEIYPTLPKISVDYALMEPASKEPGTPNPICTVRMDVNWLDVGSWPSFAKTLSPDGCGTCKAGAGETLTHGEKNNLIVNSQPGHTVAVLGCEDLIVVHTPEATLVMPRSRAEELKDLHAKLDARLK